MTITFDSTLWQERALCRQVDPDLFTPADADANTAYRRARLICRRCPVAAECLSWAMDNHERSGMWGGMTPHERTALRHGRLVDAAPPSPKDVERDARLLARYRETQGTEADRAALAREFGVSVHALKKRLTRARKRAA